MNITNKRNLRLNYKTEFISHRFKRNFVIKFCLIVVLGAVLSGSGLYLLASKTLTTTFVAGRLRIISTADFILPAVLLCCLLLIVFIGILTILVTLFDYQKGNKLLIQIKNELDKATQGNLRVNLKFRRKNDEFIILAQSADLLIQSFKNIIIDSRHDVAELESHFIQYKNSTNQPVPDEIWNHIETLKKTFSRLEI